MQLLINASITQLDEYCRMNNNIIEVSESSKRNKVVLITDTDDYAVKRN